MRDYTKGKIYSVRSHKTDLIYIGSTIQPLSVRMGSHRRDYNNYLKNGKYVCTSIEIFKLDPNPYIELIINFSCSCKEELRKEEGKWMRKMKCVNKNIAGRTQKEWYEDVGREKIKEYHKDNKNKIKEYQKEYQKNHYQINKEQKKKYYQDNKNKIEEKNKQKIKCPSCNKEMRKDSLSKHIKKNCKKINLEE